MFAVAATITATLWVAAFSTIPVAAFYEGR